MRTITIYDVTIDDAGILYRRSVPAHSPAHALQQTRDVYPDAYRILVSIPSISPISA